MKKLNEMPPSQVTCFTEDKKGNYWIGTYNKGLIFYETKKRSASLNNTDMGFPFDFIGSLLEEPDGKIWARTWGGGAALVNGDRWKTFNTSSGLNSNKIKSFFRDREGNIMLSTFGAGFAVFKGERFISLTSKMAY